MRFYTQPHRFYCGIDLHARLLAVGSVDQDGNVVRRKPIPDDKQLLLDLLTPFRPDVAVCVDCLFAWYCVADLCPAHQIPFVLGHALDLKAIHGGKAKDDDSDAEMIGRRLRGGNIPQAYVYPKGMRQTRDLLRRHYFVRQRAARITHIQISNAQYNLPPFGKKLIYAKNRQELNVVAHFPDAHVHKSSALNLAVIDWLDQQIADGELSRKRTVKGEDPHRSFRLQTIPGVGPLLGLVRRDAIHRLDRFADVADFLASARRVRCQQRAAGKTPGTGGTKSGKAHLQWAFAEAVCLLLRSCPAVKAWQTRQEKKRGQKKTLAILAAKLGRAVYQMLHGKVAFDVRRFLGPSW
jgi:transposase